MSPRLWVRVITISAIAFALWRPAFTQTKGSGSTSTGTTTGSGSTGTLPPPKTGNPNSTTNSTTNSSAGSVAPPSIMVSGRVMIEDGTAPSESVVIERVCNGSARAEGYTDTRGYFVLQLGSTNTQFQDASETAGGFGGASQQLGGMGGPGGGGGSSSGAASSTSNSTLDSRLMNCDLRARLSGYHSQTVSLMERHALDNPDVGIILLHRLTPTERAATVSTAALAVPKPADKAYNKGLNFLKKGKPEEARTSFQSAVDLYPKFSSAWFELGKLQATGGQLDDAHKSFLAASQADPQFVAAYLELALLSLHDRNWNELADVTYRALKLNSFDYPQAYFLNAVANYNLRKLDTAEKSARAAQRLDTRHIYPENSRLLGIILVDREQYAEAADALRDFLVAAPHSVEAQAVRRQLDDLEKKTIPADQMAKK
ncbi:MAG: tetratricopeptide repeat protein [Bryobacteraceae bacterium]